MNNSKRICTIHGGTPVLTPEGHILMAVITGIVTRTPNSANNSQITEIRTNYEAILKEFEKELEIESESLDGEGD
jgi:hypothetical protein